MKDKHKFSLLSLSLARLHIFRTSSYVVNIGYQKWYVTHVFVWIQGYLDCFVVSPPFQHRTSIFTYWCDVAAVNSNKVFMWQVMAFSRGRSMCNFPICSFNKYRLHFESHFRSFCIKVPIRVLQYQHIVIYDHQRIYHGGWEVFWEVNVHNTTLGRVEGHNGCPRTTWTATLRRLVSGMVERRSRISTSVISSTCTWKPLCHGVVGVERRHWSMKGNSQVPVLDQTSWPKYEKNWGNYLKKVNENSFCFRLSTQFYTKINKSQYSPIKITTWNLLFFYQKSPP